MAFKRTILRQNFVTNTAMPESAGHAMAQASRDIAGAITHITNTVDKNEFETFKLQAEKEGKIIGQRTEVVDGKNVIKPLDLESLGTFKPNMYNKANQRKIQEYFKEQAINSYSLALSNDAINASETSLITNKGKVDDKGNLLVNSASEAYLKAIKNKVPSDVWNNISAGLEKIWGVSNRKASAYQIENVRNLNYSNAVKTLDYVNNYEQNLIINGGDETDLLYVEEAKQKAFQLIDDNAKSSADASNIKMLYGTQLQSGVSQNAVTMAYGNEVPVSDILEIISNTHNNFKLDKNVDAEVVQTAMLSKLDELNKIDVNQKKENKFNSVTSAGNLMLNLVADNVIPTEVEIKSLGIIEQIKIREAITKHTKNIKTDEEKIFNDNVVKTILNIESDNINVEPSKDKSDFSDGFNVIKNKKKLDMVAELVSSLGDIRMNNSSRLKINTLTKNIANNYAEIKSDMFKANIEFAMNGDGDKVLIPSQLKSEEYINKLIRNNIIGTSKTNAYTRESWINRVNRYEVEYDKKNKDAEILSVLANKAKHNVSFNAQDILTVNKTFPKSFDYKGTKTLYNVLDPDQEVREISIKHHTSLALSTNVIPTELVEVLNNIKQLSDVDFMYAKQAYGSLKNAIKDKHPDDWEAQWELFSGNNRNKLDTLVLDSSLYSNDASKFAGMHNPTSTSRELGKIFPKDSRDGLSDQDIMNNTIKTIGENTDNNAFERFFIAGVDGNVAETLALYKFYDQSGVSNMADVLIKDPQLRNELIRNVKYQASTGKLNMNDPEKALLSATKKAFYELSGNLSLHEDKNGKVHLMSGSGIMKYAQSQIPGDSYQITKEDLIQDVLKDYNASFGGGTQNKDVQEAIKNRDIMFVPNNEIAGDQTFRVVVLSQDGTAPTIANNYKWNWENSLQNKDYEDALQKISNGGVRKLLSSFDFMSKNNIRAVMDSVKSNRQSAEKWQSIINTYNSVAMSVNNAPMIPSEILPIIDYSKSESGQKELEAYFDSTRFFRLNLR